ncbi:MAG: TPM domain-containing protein [Planctomycetota bacterium]
MRNVARLALAAGLVLAAALPARAQSPEYEGEFFSDFTHQIPARTSVEISRTLRLAAEQSKIHPMIVVIDSLTSYPNMPQDVKPFATKLVNDWKLGDVDTHKGVLALFSITDRKFYVEHTDHLDSSIPAAISKAFSGATAQALKANDVPRAMQRAAEAIASSLPRAASSQPSGTSTPTHTKTVTTHSHQATGSNVPYTPPTTWSSSGSGGSGFSIGCFGFIIASIVIVWILSTIFKAFTGVSRGFGQPLGGGFGGGGYGYGGGYGGGGGGSFLGGMATGGLLGYLFGNSGSHYGGYSSGWGSGWGSGGSSWGGGSNNSSYTDTSTTESWSWGGGSSGGDSGGSSGGGFFDSFGGGGSSGDSGSGGSW